LISLSTHVRVVIPSSSPLVFINDTESDQAVPWKEPEESNHQCSSKFRHFILWRRGWRGINVRRRR